MTTSPPRATVHVVGAGVAGLAAALAVARGVDRRPAVVLHEASPAAGGRARALPDGTDNGTHALMGANRAVLRFLDAIGARTNWVEPEPDGLPIIDLADGTARRIALSPLGWWRDPRRRPAGLTLGGMLALLRLCLPSLSDRDVATAMARHPTLHRALVEPLTVAALNTPADEASAHLLGAVLRRLGMGGPAASRLLVARRGLGPDLVEPALAELARRGVEVRLGARLRGVSLATDGRAATALAFGEQDRIALGPADAVVLALPPWEAARLLPGRFPVPEAHAPILNLHYAHPVPGERVHFFGLLGGLAQWVLVRPGLGASVTVSAADEAMEREADGLAREAWAELRRAALAFGLPGDWPEAPPRWRMVKERRATPRHHPGPIARIPRRPLANLALAGDWTWPTLPATLEAAVCSGEAAAAALMRGGGGATLGAAHPPPTVISAARQRARPA